MFEKSLYDLIRGLRNHKGSEKEYIQCSLRECRAEIRSSDIDLKATALLKLIYLEMFGHDMSWASFHVLEVMSSAKYLQKRVGYLGAIQSFRPDTEVLMLATNLIKKDVTSPLLTMIGLPLVALPHLINSSLAMSLLSDLIPRLSHSSPAIRKKTVVVLYRLALVYPDTLRPAWPKIKGMLMDESEDSSVTAAVINVVCELGWRRPGDFLSLAPRLFDLLIDSGNNWMAIKIIKLFATLTPLESRLIKKLLPPLTNIIRTTPAMSLLYECIHGIIQGGIFEGTVGQREGYEVAELCVGKLREMIMMDGDPNLKYVALLAMKKIVISHPHLISMHQDVIMGCIDDLDISIQSQALDLLAGMANSDNIVAIVDPLMRQLNNSSFAIADQTGNPKTNVNRIVMEADQDDEDPEWSLHPRKDVHGDARGLPNEHRLTIISRILGMCNQNTYSHIVDFEWYIDILVKLARCCPSQEEPPGTMNDIHHPHNAPTDISGAIGNDLLNVAVRVSTVRVEAVAAAKSLVVSHHLMESPVSSTRVGDGVLRFAVWIIGEYANDTVGVEDTLTYLLHPSVRSLSSSSICAYLQAIPKVLVSIITKDEAVWNVQRKTLTFLLLARVVHFLEPLTMHPDLEVQERSVEFLELMRVATQATSAHETGLGTPPLLLTNGLASLFIGLELNPVAPSAQRKVPLPGDLDLNTYFNHGLTSLLQRIEQNFDPDPATAEFEEFYNVRQTPKGYFGEAMGIRPAAEIEQESYQYIRHEPADTGTLDNIRAERRARNDDPYYIRTEDSLVGVETSMHDLLKHSNGGELDVDSIPIMDLDLGNQSSGAENFERKPTKRVGKVIRRYQIAADENVDFADPSLVDAAAQDTSGRTTNPSIPLVAKRETFQQSLLSVDSSGLESFSLDAGGHSETLDRFGSERRPTEDLDMQKAVLEVERLRLEMQRAAERIKVADGIPVDGTIIKKKKKKKKKRYKGDQPTPGAIQDPENSLTVSRDRSHV